ncbi:hypothetical protein SSPO_027800 [Streptomyces antimycoticus]|uniref:Uncharacterized protein n=1 Tax=Streptomyces antimycoticus TaxID=68175 RepID=A0A499UHE6_9ACTN|nr:hypothetical protein SSPO_027800 [Streptomyces antimycoticus]
MSVPGGIGGPSAHGAERFADAFGRKLGGGALGSVPVVLGLLAIWLIFQILNPHFLSRAISPTSAWTSSVPA